MSLKSMILGGLWQYNDSFQTAPGLLLIYAVGNGEDKYFTNGHPIANGVMGSYIYKNEMNNFINEKNINKIIEFNGDTLMKSIKRGWSIDGEENLIKELDLGRGVGKTTAYITGNLNNDGNIDISFIIEDRYYFHDDDELGWGNKLGLIPQQAGAGKPFSYMIEIKNTYITQK